jgi:two-component system NtrC family sensor kinase
MHRYFTKVINKILKSFCTAKLTKQGAGWSLNLSYDIIKADGGEIRVETKENEDSVFIIQLPFA